MKEIRPIQIGKRMVGPGCPTYIIAEIGINHNGSLELAKEMIRQAATAGADAVKFQTRTIEIVYSPEELKKPRPVPRDILENALKRAALPAEAVMRLKHSDFTDTRNGDLKYALEFSLAELSDLVEYSQNLGVDWLTSCWDTSSLQRIESNFNSNSPAIKIASACNEDDELLRQARKTGKPVILSTGMTDLAGVEKAVLTLGDKNLVLLHCTSVYPKNIGALSDLLKLVNLQGLKTLRDHFEVPIGYSNHYSGIMPTYAAVAMGASVIETHVTMERGMWGSDQASSIEFSSFVRLCQLVRELSVAMGNGEIIVYPDELEVANKLRRVRRKS